jgi:hypothetical protein
MLQGLLQLDRYLGFDLVSAACGLAGMYLLGNRNRKGFLLCIAASAFGIVFGALAQSLPLLLLHVILLAVNLRGFQKWQLQVA